MNKILYTLSFLCFISAVSCTQELGGDDTERFSQFLWKLERNKEISEEERRSFIGVYRLLHQVEKSDGAAIGAVLNQGADLTLKNLLSQNSHLQR